MRNLKEWMCILDLTNQHLIKEKLNNSVRTSKYTWLTWAPLSLLYQFTRAANIYFLYISILTCMPFSPKTPASMIGTFAAVLIFTMFKELFEDYYRMRSDKEINNSTSKILDYETGSFVECKWKDIKQGDILKISKDETFPTDLLFLYSKTDVIFVDTMNLDGETNLKPKVLASKFLLNEITDHNIQESSSNEGFLPKLNTRKLIELKGKISCEFPNENLEQWDGNLSLNSKDSEVENLKINCLLLRGCFLRNTEYVIGAVVYIGQETKIMKNAKKPPRKVSNLMRMMNYMLYTVFILQIGIISLFASLSVAWISEKGQNYAYLNMGNVGSSSWFIQLLTYWVAYSHMIPISLYVIIEVLKLVQSYLIKADDDMYDEVSDQRAECRNSDLIEELGQIDCIFSDKTGTLTCNSMIFKKCNVDGVVYSEDSARKTGNVMVEEEKDQLKADVDFELGEESRGAFITANQEKLSRRSPPREVKLSDKIDSNIGLLNFFRFLGICHSVMVDHDPETGEVNYQSSSPDELALVKAAGDHGIKLTKRTKDYVELVENGVQCEYRILAEFPFNSDRKRMSVIFEENGRYYVYCKGADSIMSPRIRWKQGEEIKVFNDLEKFAIEGLRTLVMGQKEISSKDYHEFSNLYNELQTSNLRDKEEKIFDLYDQYEMGLEYVGASAIEDKLQDKVPETIAKLMSANIRVWVLTGDKQETAIEIAKSCQLIQKGMEVVILTIKGIQKSKFDECRNTLKEMISEFKLKHKIRDEDAGKGFKNVNPRDNLAIVIDGPTLEIILGVKEIELEFFSFALYAKSVVCCRVSPKQKAMVVKLSKYKKGSISLSVGDGANDVPMIMQANIGVGIRGKEGTQAVRSADYAISQFMFLQKLILVHGRLGYRRVAWVICYYFYKNILLVFTEIYFAFYNGFSGQIYFADWLPMLYNALWTSLTCLFAFSFEKDVMKETYKIPSLYAAGQKREYFSYLTFWKWVFLSIYHGMIIFFGCTYGLKGIISSDGKTLGLWFASTTAFSCIIHLVTLKLVIELLFLNWIVLVAGGVSLVLYWAFVIVFNTHPFALFFQPQIDNVYFEMFSNGQFWIALFLLPVIALIPDATIKYFNQLYRPTTSDIALMRLKELQDSPDSESDFYEFRSKASTKKETINPKNKNDKQDRDQKDEYSENSQIKDNRNALPIINTGKDPLNATSLEMLRQLED